MTSAISASSCSTTGKQLSCKQVSVLPRHSDSTGTRRQVIMRRPSMEANTLGVGCNMRSLEEEGESKGGKRQKINRERKPEREKGRATHTHTHIVLRQDSKTRTLNWTKAPVTAPTQHKCDIQHCSGGLTTPSSCSKILLPSVVPSSPELYTSTHFAAPLGLFRAS